MNIITPLLLIVFLFTISFRISSPLSASPVANSEAQSIQPEISISQFEDNMTETASVLDSAAPSFWDQPLTPLDKENSPEEILKKALSSFEKEMAKKYLARTSMTEAALAGCGSKTKIVDRVDSYDYDFFGTTIHVTTRHQVEVDKNGNVIRELGWYWRETSARWLGSGTGTDDEGRYTYNSSADTLAKQETDYPGGEQPSNIIKTTYKIDRTENRVYDNNLGSALIVTSSETITDTSGPDDIVTEKYSLKHDADLSLFETTFENGDIVRREIGTKLIAIKDKWEKLNSVYKSGQYDETITTDIARHTPNYTLFNDGDIGQALYSLDDVISVISHAVEGYHNNYVTHYNKETNTNNNEITTSDGVYRIQYSLLKENNRPDDGKDFFEESGSGTFPDGRLAFTYSKDLLSETSWNWLYKRWEIHINNWRVLVEHEEGHFIWENGQWVERPDDPIII